jgi:GNAT superfamily N-acetyltransferase
MQVTATDSLRALGLGLLGIRQCLRPDLPPLADSLSDSTSLTQLENRWRERELGYREILVAEVDGNLVGTVSLHEPGVPPRSMHLFALDVAEGWRNRGIGTALVEHVLEEARSRDLLTVHLEVRVDNPARRLYHRLGFRRVGSPFLNGWWRYEDDGSRDRVEEWSVRMVRRVGKGRARRAG